MSEGAKMKLELAQMIAARFMKHLEPFVSIISVAGSVRREVEYCHDIEVVCVPKDEFSMGQCFPENFYGMTTNGTRLKKFKYGQDGLIPISIELYITNLNDYGRILAIRTGSSAYSHHLAMQWNRRGWAGTEDGLRRKDECNHKSTWKIKPEYKLVPTLPPVFDTEEKFFAFIGVEYIHPKARSWVSNKPEYNYKL
jgi:DNA polymerase/3'-5' exonuclease PolX